MTKHDKQPEDGFDSQASAWTTFSHLTSYDALDKSISMFNSIVRGRDPSLTLDLHVVDIRDAIAHGRILTHHPSKPMQLFKYTKRKKVEVKLAVTNTPEWFANELKLVL